MKSFVRAATAASDICQAAGAVYFWGQLFFHHHQIQIHIPFFRFIHVEEDFLNKHKRIISWIAKKIRFLL